MQATKLHWKRGSFANGAALTLLVCTGLNLNGLFTMAFRVGQVVTPIMVICSIVLILAYGREGISNYVVTFIGMVVIYLSFGTYFYTQEDLKLLYQMWQAYTGSILIVLGIAGFVSSIQQNVLVGRDYAYLKLVFLGGAASVWASPVLYRYYLDPPLSFEQRMGGFFANPNEAGVASVFALTLCLAIFLQIAAIGVATGAIVLTFSKSAMSSGLIIAAWFLTQRVKGVALLVAPLILVLVAIALIQASDLVIDFITHSIDLTPEQQERVLLVGRILSGEIGSKESTGRSDVWGIAMERIMAVFPGGGGLGAFHLMVGGIMENDVWLGTHNTLLMMWGEAGLPGLLALIGFIATVAIGLLRYARSGIEVPLFLGLFIEMNGSHNALETRYSNVILGVILGSLALRRKAVAQDALRKVMSEPRNAGAMDPVSSHATAPYGHNVDGALKPADRSFG